jgi:methionyl-tRNA synthetase
MSHFFITTAIDYTNGAPHIGHAYEKVLADVLARYHWLKGDQVFFLTGVDQHGQKVQQSAEKEGIAPQQFVDGVTAKFVALWDKLDVHYENRGGWAATTSPKHKDCVRAILQRLWDDRDPATGASRWIYKKTQRGFYSVRQEQFLTDKERGPDGEFGPEWGQVEERDEENYYFKLSDHKQWLLDLIDRRSAEGRPFVVPDFRVAELRNAVEKLDGDLCISRPLARLSWGIPFPFDPEFVTYVWFDALVNYISFAPHYDPTTPRPPEAFLRWWKYEAGQSSGVTHVIGKDILIPAHGVYWPIMLKALGFADDEMPTLLVHGWWNIAGAKMSKSVGNIVDPDALADKYGPETLRYYLMSDIATGRDADFSEERLIQRYNTDLANSLGNLLNRTLSMAAKYREGTLSSSFSIPSNTEIGDLYINLKGQAERSAGVSRVEFERNNPAEAIAHISDLIVECNGLVEKSAPWKLAKDSAQAEKLDAVLYTLAESLRIIAILISPVLPRAAHGIFDQLGWKLAESGRSQRFHLDDARWGGLPDGHVLGKPTPLFPRIEALPAA